ATNGPFEGNGRGRTASLRERGRGIHPDHQLSGVVDHLNRVRAAWVRDPLASSPKSNRRRHELFHPDPRNRRSLHPPRRSCPTSRTLRTDRRLPASDARSRRIRRRRRSRSASDRERPEHEWQRLEGAGRPIRRHQGATWRHHHHRRAGSQKRVGMSEAARQAIEKAARDSRARLLAFLAARSRDVAAAEDALSDAFRAALESWPCDGVPDNPEAWLLTAARRRLIDAARHHKVLAQATPGLVAALDEAQVFTDDHVHEFPDERLKLLFVCAHPAIDAAARTPLMLQTVLGLDAVRIASAFLVKPSAMGQRLSRVKTKIRDAGIAFEIPHGAQLAERLDAVLEAIYAAYGSGWDDIAGADPRRKGLALEALEL